MLQSQKSSAVYAQKPISKSVQHVQKQAIFGLSSTVQAMKCRAKAMSCHRDGAPAQQLPRPTRGQEAPVGEAEPVSEEPGGALSRAFD
jgi:hypothetical protein